MRGTRVTFPELALIAGTRALLGAGLGLLLADRLPETQRKAVGWTLVLVGAVSTIPLALEVLGDRRSADRLRRTPADSRPSPPTRATDAPVRVTGSRTTGPARPTPRLRASPSARRGSRP